MTRREDVSVHEVSEDFGLDLIVTIVHERKPGLRQLGVELRGDWAEVSAEEADVILQPSMQHLLRYGPFPYPVLLFFYTMENGEAWYTWATEPYITSDGGFKLQANEKASCHPLDDSAIDEIISRVGAWYDAFFATTSKETPARLRK